MAERAAKTIDERFDEVSQAFREQRDFTEFCYDRLRGELRGDLIGVEARLTQRIGALEGKVEGLETSMNRRFTHHELLLTEILNEVKKR